MTSASSPVSPTILVGEQVVGGYHGETLTLECKVDCKGLSIHVHVLSPGGGLAEGGQLLGEGRQTDHSKVTPTE